MDETTLLQELEALAAELGVEVRYERLESSGGLCRYGDRTCIIVDRRLGTGRRLGLLAQALARLPLETVFVRPQVREFIERCRAAKPRHPRT